MTGAQSQERSLYEVLQLGFDPAAVREKYRVERDKRLRPEGSMQYIKMDGQFLDFNDDHFVEVEERPAVSATADVVIIGAGFGGLQAGAHLRREGIADIRLIDRAADVGGNWYWNRYPGAACDTEAYCYLPLLEETGYMPSHRYVDADEIQGYAQLLARHFDLYRDALFQTTVTGVTWSEDRDFWTVETDRGDVIESRYVIVAGGETVSPKLPGIPGIKTFKGESFHSSRWNYNYTGGSHREPLEKLADKRVAVIGTGASAIQCVAALGASAQQLYVFQRTASCVDPRNNHPTDVEWWRELTSTPGWQERRMCEVVALVETATVPSEPLADLGYADQLMTVLGFAGRLAATAAEAGVELDQMELMELANMCYMEQLRARCDELIEDPVTAEAIKPYYRLGCKRPTWNDGYLETFNLPNVSLIDTDGRGVERITETSVVANGVEYEVDLIIYASGLEGALPGIFTLARYPIVGRHGVTLDQHWVDGYRTFLGVQVSQLPNYFHMTIIGNGLGANYLYGNGKQAKLIAHVIGECERQGIVSVEPTLDAEDDWRATLEESHRSPLATLRHGVLAECTPGLYNGEGQLDHPGGLFANVYGSGSLSYIEILEDWQQEGVMPGLATKHAVAK